VKQRPSRKHQAASRGRSGSLLPHVVTNGTSATALGMSALWGGAEVPDPPPQCPLMTLAECRCWSLTPHAEDVIVVLLSRVTSKASGGGVLADHRAGLVACGETFKAPAQRDFR
jgi:hypothetical protein